MRTRHIENAGVLRVAIQQEIERSNESRYDYHLHGVLLVAGRQGCIEVAPVFVEDPHTVQRWVKRFEQQGFDGLRDGERSGRLRSLEESQCESLGRDLRRIVRATSAMRRISGTAGFSASTYGEHRGQRAVPPCHSARTTRTQIPQRPVRTVSPARQPAACADRACVEGGPACGHAPSICCTLDAWLDVIQACFDRWRHPNSVLRSFCGTI